jgi:hypothetical protein
VVVDVDAKRALECVATHPGGVRLGERVPANEFYWWEAGLFGCAGGAGIDL